CHYNEKVLRIEKDSVMSEKMRAIGIEPDMNAGLFRRYVLPPYISTTQIGKVAQSAHDYGAKVVFTGHGGDEGVSHRCNPYELFYNREYLHYFSYMWESTKGLKHRCYKTVMRSLKNLTKTRKQLRSPFVSVFASKIMLAPEIMGKYETKKGVSNTFAYDPLSYVRNGGSRNRLDIVALLGEYCGARYFAPYLDYRVIDYALSIPRHMYLKEQKNRYIIREAFWDIIPESLYNLTGKEDTSCRNVEKTEVDIVEHVQKKNRLVGMLNREYWNGYLNWEELEDWASVAAEEERDSAMFMGIDKCLSLQNLITFSRKVGEAESV
ncbi:MAG: asparagine synthase, partial [Lachnospiraceae bacterium]|nr:asparagine synthase [Lachnospiraceae bacterium]